MRDVFDKQALYKTMEELNSRRMSPKQKKMFLKSQNLDLDVEFRSPPKAKKTEEDAV